MNQKDFVPRIPYGTKDVLPREAQRKRTVEGALADLFAHWGYREVVTPTFEHLETLTAGTGGELTRDMFKFLDKDNRMLALRPDMTAPIARVAATRMRDEPGPHRLFYLANVFRYEQAQAGRQCEFYQAGVECLGAAGPAADAEVVALAIESMRRAGLTDFQVGLGQVDFVNGVMSHEGLSPDLRRRIKQCLTGRDVVGLGELADCADMPGVLREPVRQIPFLHGGLEVLDRARAMTANPVSLRAIDNLEDINRLLTDYGVGDHVVFDLGIVRDFDYYTGMVFEAYTRGMGFPLCGGGRYDRMLSSFGQDWPATGFALGIERILLALDRQGIPTPAETRDVFVAWSEGAVGEAIRTASALRREGVAVELAVTAMPRDDAEKICVGKGFSRMIYCPQDQ